MTVETNGSNSHMGRLEEDAVNRETEAAILSNLKREPETFAALAAKTFNEAPLLDVVSASSTESLVAPVAITVTPPAQRVDFANAPVALASPGMPAAPPRRFVRTAPRVPEGITICLYAPEGTGKTVFCANAPEPFFLGAENKFGSLDARMIEEGRSNERPTNMAELYEQIEEIEKNPGKIKTVVLDTIDWVVENLLIPEVLSTKASWKKLGMNADYGAPRRFLKDESKRLVHTLLRLKKTGMNVIVTAHADNKNVKNSHQATYKQWSLRTEKEVADEIRASMDCVLFAYPEVLVLNEDASNDKSRKIPVDCVRMMMTEMAAFCYAKNAYNLPSKMPFSWTDFEESVKKSRGNPDEMRAGLRAKIFEILKTIQDPNDADFATKVRSYLERNPNLSITNLTDSLNRVRAKFEELETAKEAAET